MKLAEGSLLHHLWELTPLQVGPIWGAGFLLLYLMNGIDFTIHWCRGTPREDGITKFRAVMLGDSLLFPAIASQGAVLMEEEAPWFLAQGWQVSWASWLALGVAILVTLVYMFPLNLLDEGRDWTKPRRGRTNLWGIYHFFYFLATSYLLADYGIRGGGLLAAHPEVEVVARYVASLLMFGAFVMLSIMDEGKPHRFWRK